ncbi:glycosyltransferase [Gryllotalpicola protaetiae]|uniref:4,4'-diaponeurosporenoate glycosyltransferase n=1 Tax=Gryllotalpicola protaetiae TaxID=2419771 RepID=A0A387BQC4_9MICO|nr:glycosyltransferase [Gryllotalpicola protaetiae]AYG03176.1 glycosyltransferase [Gryllotalpicola protaetiae]
MVDGVSVIIPAHNEAHVIGGTLRRLVDTDIEGRLELIVATNGCTDRTGEIAASVSPRVRVIEVDAASKIAALNAGDEASTWSTRAYLDADIDITADALLASADALGDGPMLVSAPRMLVDTAGSSAPVRMYYRVWELTDYRLHGMVGSGIYIVSGIGRARWGSFPDVIADDLFAQRQFAEHERLEFNGATFTMRAPRDLRTFLHRQTRIVAGNREAAAHYPELERMTVAPGVWALIGRLLRRPWLWPAALVYTYASLEPRRRAAVVRARGAAQSWNRDETRRVSAVQN